MRRLRGDRTTVFQYLKEIYNKVGDCVESVGDRVESVETVGDKVGDTRSHKEKTRSNRYTLQWERLHTGHLYVSWIVGHK